MIKKILSYFICVLTIVSGFGQSKQNRQDYLPINGPEEQCLTSQRHEKLMKNDPAYRAARELAEKFIADYTIASLGKMQVTYTIPVVVHVIHRGEAVGSGGNISDAQIISAINNLNAAYSNTSTSLTTYTGVNTNMQFCLAQRDASGNPSTGIVRVNGTSVTGYSTYGISDGSCSGCTDNEIAVKALSKWDNTKYYNFWIVEEIDNNGGGSGTQGYAYYPGAGSNVDGAVMLYNAFGYDPDGSLGYNLKSYTNMNVTPIHELGHAFDLRHTFEGDGTGSTCPTNTSCSTQGDLVCDTDPHKRSSSNCPTGTNTCTGNPNANIVHNFMDYSSDVCQTEFKAGQVTRMNATLNSGGSRYSLTQSSGCNPVYTRDASISAILSPTASYCQTTFSPIVTLKNFGSATLTSVNILYNIDGAANSTYAWSGSLANGATIDVTLPSVTTSAGAHTFNATVSNPNGAADQYTTNDAKSVSFTISAGTAIPYTQNFEAAFPGTGWSVVSSDGNTGAWGSAGTKQWVQRGTSGNGASANSAAINCFFYNTGTGQIDELISPSISLSGATSPQLTFKVAYAYYGSTNYERLRVLISIDCGVTFVPISPTAYDKSYTTLATAGVQGSDWGPTSGNWRTETIDLSAYANNTIVLKWECTNGYGNNLYLDDITIQNCAGASITAQPSNSTICTGANTSFSITASGASSYQWQVSTNGGSTWTNLSNTAPYSNVTTATMNITSATTGISTYQYHCVVTGACGNVTSNAATLTVNPNNTITLTSAAGTNNQTKCINTAITNITYSTTGATGATFSGLPAGVTGNWAANVVTISGTPSASGTFSYTVTLTGGCGTVTATGTITVNLNNTVTLTSAAGTNNQTKCINTAITNITYSTTGATGATFSGLPTGVTGNWAANVVTISGTPSASGTFSYTVTLTGGCGSVNATGTITVNPNNTVTLTSAAGTNNQTKCINTAITNITYSTTGATGATFSGLPTGVTGNWAANVVTISGTPSASGTFSYTVTLTGGCGTVTATGTITVNPNNTVTLTSAAGTNSQSVCINTAITNITYSTTGATGATFSGLPTGVTGNWAANVVTISGTPSASGTFSYTVTLTGGCGTVTATGSISVVTSNTITLTSAAGTDAQTKCINTAITNITYSTTGATGATFSGLPTGVTGNWAANVVTISGTPSASGTFNYSVTLTGGCGAASANGTITVNPIPDAAFNTLASSYCLSQPAVTLTPTKSGGTFSGPGVSGNTFTASAAGIGGPYTITYNITVSGCSNSSSQTVSVTSIDDATFTLADFCVGSPSTANITGLSGGSFVVSPTTNGETINSGGEISNAVGGTTYTVTYTTPSGPCQNSSNVNVQVFNLPSTPTITQSNDTLFCSPSASGYQWYLNGTPVGTSSQFYVAGTTSGNYTVEITDANSCTSTASNTFAYTYVGIENITNNLTMEIYPNPIINEATVVINGVKEHSQFVIVDMLGRVILSVNCDLYRTNNKAQFTINRQNLSNSIYYYQLRNDNKSVATGKLVIED